MSSDFLFEGRPPPSVGQWGETVEQMPKWLSDYTKGLIARANAIAAEPYQPYGGPRIAGFRPEEEMGFGMTAQNVGAYQPYLQAGTGFLGGALNQAAGMLGSGTQTFPGAVGEYMDPFIGNVLNRQADLASRQFTESTLPALQGAFTRAGQFGSDRMMELAGRATRDFSEGLTDQQLAALSGAYGQAADIFGQDAARALQGAGIAGELGIQGARQYGALGEMASRMGYGDAAAMEALGRTLRGQDQRSLDLAYQDFLRQRDYPRESIDWMSSVIRGMPYDRMSRSREYGPADIYQPSGLSQLASLLTAGAGAYETFFPRETGARGGLVQYAEGGFVEKPAEPEYWKPQEGWRT